ncbi:MAG: hypothetical protein GEU28_13960 [Dehalococcoidia bacterium]|nr:hypothetical protein [Dehalococcoidia bacterium]
MPPKSALYVAAGAVVALAFVIALVRGSAPDTVSEWLAPIGPAVALASAGLWLFDRYAWRWRGLRKLTGRPLLHGTWHGTLRTDWVDPQTGQQKSQDDNVFLVIRQRFSDLTVRMLTQESTSGSLEANLIRDPDGVHRVAYLYDNTPRPEVRHRSQIHYGATVLVTPKDTEAEGIEGHYFTDRTTSGEMRFHTRYKQLAETWVAAMNLTR